MNIYRVVLLLLAALHVFVAVPAGALEAPKSTVVLTVSGAVQNGNADGTAVFDRAMLESLDWREIETHTYFTKGLQTFAGPTLSSLLAALGVDSGTLRARAINDYAVTIPVEHAAAHNVILAMDHNGQPMRVRDKGPIWVVYPVAEDELSLKAFENYMIWQLVGIEVQP